MSPAGGDAKKPDATAALEPGRRLGRYRLCARIAGGGMGAVYLARVEGPVGFDKLLALKIIHSHLAEDEEFIRMFLDEARIASRITHPNVCSVFDFGVEAGTYFIAMEYLLGETVGHIVKTVAKRATEDPPDVGLAGYWCVIAAQAAEGLHAAHELRGPSGEPLGVVHRDVSPSNLFVGYDGHVQVMDFGIARAAGRLHVTQAGAIKGKLAYMAPEQLKRLEPDRRVDVWALGVVLWEMLTQQRLFRRDSEMDTMAAVATAPIEPPSALVPGLPARIDEVVLKALARERDERYPTARALARDLHRAVATLPEPVGVSDLADFLESTFASQRAERLSLVERARQMGDEALPESTTRERDEASSSVRVHDIHDLPTQVTPSSAGQTESGQRVAAVPIRPSEAPDPPESFPDAATEAEKAPLGARVRAVGAARDAPPTRADGLLSTRHRVAIAGAAAALLLGIVLALSMSGDDEEPREPVVELASAAVGQSAARSDTAGGRTEDPVGGSATGEAAAEPAAARGRERGAAEASADRAPDVETQTATSTARARERAAAEASADRTPDVEPQTATSTTRSPTSERTSSRSSAASPRAVTGTMRSGAAAVAAEPPESSTRRETRTAVQASTPAATGVAVVIGTGGWADVYTGGRRVGRTPARITLPAGRHVLELRPGGDGAAVRRVITVPPNGEARLAVPLSP